MARAHRTKLKPILKWAGGKGQLIGELLRRVPQEFGAYHEPFMGGGALYFALWGKGRIRRAYLSDLNHELIEMYLTVRDDVEGVIRALRAHRNEEQYYYRVRATNPGSLTPGERAARLIYLNKTCFNGLFRVNSRGDFNVPFGDNPHATICDAEGLRAAAAALRDAEPRCEPFETVLDHAERGDLVYFDPPYQPLSRTSHFTAYHSAGFGEEDQRRLAEVFDALVARGVHVLLSNSDTPLVRTLYRRCRREIVKAARAINSKTTGRGKITELLIRPKPARRISRSAPGGASSDPIRPS